MLLSISFAPKWKLHLITLKCLCFNLQLSVSIEIDEEEKVERLKNLMGWNWNAVIDLSEDVIIVIDDESDVEVDEHNKSVVNYDTQGDTTDDNKQPTKRARKDENMASFPSEEDNIIPTAKKKNT